jgi:hypothetical protein
MDSLEMRILLASIVEVQECVDEQYRMGQIQIVTALWDLQQEKAERLRDGNHYTRPDSRGTTEAE